MTAPILGKRRGGGALNIDVERLIVSRLLVQANSGAGKSWALRRLLEVTHGRLQHIVLDVDGEFHTLRERYDYILAAAKGGDCLAHPKTAKLLARRLLELNVSAIVDISELEGRDRMTFARMFLNALMNAPRKLWHPALIVVDEAHIFCPEKGKPETADAVISLMERGRKRGFCGVLATQRISKLNKDAAAEANNKLIGRASLDIDRKRAADELGFSTRDERMALRLLKPGEFYAFGPALLDEVTLINVGAVLTTHPRPGMAAPPPAPAPEALRDALAQLADLPAEADEEASTIEDLRRQVRDLQSELRQVKRNGVDQAAVAAARAEGAAAEQAVQEQRVAEMQAAAMAEIDKLPGIHIALMEAFSVMDKPVARKPAISQPHVKPAPPPVPKNATPGIGDRPALGGGCLRMLQVLAQRYPARFTKAQWGALAGLKHTGGTFGTYLSRLKKWMYIDVQRDLFGATEAGVAAAGVLPPTAETPEEIVEMWGEKLGSGPRRLLDAIVAVGDVGIARERLAIEVGLTANAGTFGTYLSRLRSNALIVESDGVVRASGILIGAER